MKLLFTTSALLYTLANGDEEVPAPTPAPRRFNSIVSMAYSQVSTNLSKNDFEAKIKKYGCHCFPADTKSAGGTGAAVDALDSMCKKLANCHKCINIEFGTEAIDVNDGKYTWGLENDGSLNCDKNAKNPARKALCECDREFAYNLKSEWDDNSNFHNEYFWLNNRHARKNEGSVFSYEATCQSTGGNGGNNNNGGGDACCGIAYPHKEPYKTGSRACCGNELYSLVTQECCGSEAVAIGTC